MRSPPRGRTSSTSPPQPKRTSSSNPASLLRRASAPAILPSAPPVQSVDNGLAICLFGVGAKTMVYDAEFEEDRRRRVVMNEVLPDAEMWKKWEANEAPLRQGRGWYPALDRHFLELLVISEIAALSNPLNAGGSPGQAERVHRHAVRVRRVACDRIGQERLGAYCDRVKEAFEAYVAASAAPARGGASQAGWGVADANREYRQSLDEWGSEDGDEDEDEDEDEARGRRLSREGSQNREMQEDDSRGPDRQVGSWGEDEPEEEEEGRVVDPMMGGVLAEVSEVAEASMGSEDSGGSQSDDEASMSGGDGDEGKEEDINPFADAFMEEIDLALPFVLAPTILIHDADDGRDEEGSGIEMALPALSPTQSDSDSDSVAGSGSCWGGAGAGADVGIRIELDDVDERDEVEVGQADVEMDNEKKRAVASASCIGGGMMAEPVRS